MERIASCDLPIQETSIYYGMFKLSEANCLQLHYYTSIWAIIENKTNPNILICCIVFHSFGVSLQLEVWFFITAGNSVLHLQLEVRCFITGGSLVLHYRGSSLFVHTANCLTDKTEFIVWIIAQYHHPSTITFLAQLSLMSFRPQLHFQLLQNHWPDYLQTWWRLPWVGLYQVSSNGHDPVIFGFWGEIFKNLL